ncbi:MAG TPA: TrmH family RNA methyltransferase [Candidatus Saccharimonadales bacterium]|nr:TrmH family RNA methyltransferase [Candidatus Saccharimonadales bacterium]
MRDIVLIAHNLRSIHNVGSLLRTAEGLGVSKVYLTGYTPYPQHEGDSRMPHIATKISRQMNKTALDAEHMVPWEHYDSLDPVLATLQADGFMVAAIEQADTAISLPDYQPPGKIALLVGREVEGVEPEVLALCDAIVEIPMFGRKESFNVVQAAAMGLYHCRFAPFEALS